MATIDQTIATIEAQFDAQVKREQKARAEIKLIIEQGEAEGRSAMTDEERESVKVAFERAESAKGEQKSLKEKLALAERVKADEAEADVRAAEVTPTVLPKPAHRTADVHVGREERTYTKGSDPSGRQFLRDIGMQFMYQDPTAAARLSRHMHEERVERAGSAWAERANIAGAGVGAFTGLVVPQYLVDMVAPAVANLRPFADICNKHPLPADGMSVNISRITTASKAGLQPTELTDMTDTTYSADMDDTLLTANIQTAAGTQILSRQAIDRGTGIEDTVLQDLFARYNTVLDNTLINQATNGLSAMGQNVDCPTASFSGAKLYAYIMNGAANVEAAMLAMGQPTHVLMHSRRWYYLAAQMSSTWPLINFAGVPVQAIGTGANGGYDSGVRGVLPNGLKVIVDNNIITNGTAGSGTNEDELYVVPQNECHLWEDASAPALIRAEQPYGHKLGVMFVVYGYFAYTFGRYTNAISKLTGAGLTTPTF